MSGFEIRPRFREEAPVTKDFLKDFFKKRLEKSKESITGVVWDHQVILKIPTEEQHFWSPQLSLSLEWQEGGVVIRGMIGPRSSVWLMFVFFYFFLGFIAMIVSVMGFSQLNLGLSAGILWLLPVIGIIIGLMLFSARTGQRLGRAEMEKLYNYYQATVKEAELAEQQIN